MATTANITVDASLKAQLIRLARAGQEVGEFVEALLRRVAATNVRFERGLTGFPRSGAPILKREDVDRLLVGSGFISCDCAS